MPTKLKQNYYQSTKNDPDIQQVLLESNHGYDYKETIEYLLQIDERYKTKWEYNLFDVFPELNLIITKY